MQQQMPQQEQCGNQQQIGQPVMLCPVQYVQYDTPVILPQPPPQEEQFQQNQILINVKNPPPWIQNRTQNQVVYVQQLPNNYQPYIHPQMIQNPLYHPQMSYQIQPVLAQDNRQFIQMPNVNHYNMVQNPTTQIIKEEAEKMPLLTQMLSQKALANKTTNVTNVRPNITTTVNMTRPMTQNQQVQTDNVSPNIKGRPRNVPPQIITINPMQQRQITRKQETVMNVRPTNIRNDVPQHIRTKIPNSISVKSINNTRTIIRPFDLMSSPQNFYYDSNRNSLVMSVQNPNTETKNIVTNTGYLKPNYLQETNIRTAMPIQYPVQVSNVPPFINMTTVKNQAVIDNIKQIVNVNSTAKSNDNTLNIHDNIIKNLITDTSVTKNTESEVQTEDKLVRNTVFVQARGRVLNDKELSQNQSMKRAFDGRLKEEEKQETTLIIEAKSSEEALNIRKKIKVEVSENCHESNKILINPSAANMNIKVQQSRISNLQMNTDNSSQKNTGMSDNSLKPTILTPETNKTKNVPVASSKSSENIELPRDENNSVKASKDIERDNVEKTKALKDVTDKVSNDSDVKEETEINNVKKKQGKITVLTHVLEGYIIQESNVAFPIQKPTMEKEIKKQVIPNANKQDEEEENADKKHESKGHYPWKSLNTSIESDKEMEFAVIDKENPFSNVKKCTVEKWTAEQLSTHLEKYNWTETAAKLLDEEIDGESILLVNKDQLVAIGVSEEHAEVIGAFVAS